MAHYTTLINFLFNQISRYDFRKIVDAHDGDKRIRTLTTENLFKSMLFAQLVTAILNLTNASPVGLGNFPQMLCIYYKIDVLRHDAGQFSWKFVILRIAELVVK